MRSWTSTASLLTALTGLLMLSGASSASAQGSPFVPGQREIYSLDLAKAKIGPLPAEFRPDGNLEVVNKNGKRELKASSRSSFVVTLPDGQVLPQNFTLEFDILPRGTENFAMEEMEFEATITENAGPASALVKWGQHNVALIGGGVAANNGGMDVDVPVPDDVRLANAGRINTVGVRIEGPALTVFTNGTQVASVPNVRIPRSAVLRVVLWAMDATDNVVYLSRLRIAESSGSTGGTGGTSSTQTSTPSAVDRGTINAVSAPAPASNVPGASAPQPVTGVLASAPTTATGMTTTVLPAGCKAGPGCYRVVILGLSVGTPTKDTVNSADGQGDEVYAAAVTYTWNRQTGEVLDKHVVRTVEYGDTAALTRSPDRIKAGAKGPQGGLTGQSLVPDGLNSNVPPQSVASDRFPLLVWQGTLTDGGDAVLVVPSIWEKDITEFSFMTYRSLWLTQPPATTLLSQAVTLQIPVNALIAGKQGIQPGPPVLFTLSDVNGNVLDRPIGLTAQPLVATYEDRFMVLTREKVAALATGAGTNLAIVYDEPMNDPFLGGAYTLYLRVERVQ